MLTKTAANSIVSAPPVIFCKVQMPQIHLPYLQHGQAMKLSHCHMMTLS